MSNRDAAANNKASSEGARVTIVGRLTNEGVECQALRGDDGQLYTLLGGELGGLPVETRVRVLANGWNSPAASRESRSESKA